MGELFVGSPTAEEREVMDEVKDQMIELDKLPAAIADYKKLVGVRRANERQLRQAPSSRSQASSARSVNS